MVSENQTFAFQIYFLVILVFYKFLLTLYFKYQDTKVSGNFRKIISAHYVTLGCKLNFAETSTLSDRLAKEGVVPAAKDAVADICVVNTCTVTETSNHKCRQVIHKAIRQNPGALVVVMGCYAQLAAGDIAAMEGVDLVISMEHKARAVELILKAYEEHVVLKAEAEAALGEAEAASGDEVKIPSLHRFETVALKDIRTFVPSCSRGERTRYFLKVQDGCDYFCTYCAIPIARGHSRNGSIAEIVAQAEQAAAEGGREIVITGVNIGDFGKTTGETFFDLVKALDGVEGIERYRISSIEPNLLTEEIIDFCAQSRKFMPHFHIPLQSGSDDVLRLMHRRYNTSLFASRIEYIKKVMPDAFIGVDIIVGTRGETDEFFEDSFAFAKDIDVAQYHVFSYSERPGTAALRIPYVVDDKVKHARSQRLLELSEQKRIAFYEQCIGQVRPVLAEYSHRGLAVKGFTDNYVRVEVADAGGAVLDNQIVNCRLVGFNADKTALVGVLVDVPI